MSMLFMWHHQKEIFHPYFIRMTTAKFRSVGCRRKNQLTQMISKWKIIIILRIHRGRIIHLLQECETYVINWFQCRGIMLFFKNCIPFIKRQFKLLFHHIECLDILMFIFKKIKYIQISKFLMIHYVMRILETTCYHLSCT